VKDGCETVPAGVSVCECVPIADPVNVSAGTVPALPVKVSAGTVPAPPVKVGTPAGQATVPAGVPALIAAFVPVAVTCGATPVEVFPVTSLGAAVVADAVAALPVNVCVCVARALPENVGTPAGQAIVPLGVKLAVPFVPAGVKLAVPFVPAGVPALTAEVA
jgi:hypothetical protein